MPLRIGDMKPARLLTPHVQPLQSNPGKPVAAADAPRFPRIVEPAECCQSVSAQQLELGVIALLEVLSGLEQRTFGVSAMDQETDVGLSRSVGVGETTDGMGQVVQRFLALLPPIGVARQTEELRLTGAFEIGQRCPLLLQLGERGGGVVRFCER